MRLCVIFFALGASVALCRASGTDDAPDCLSAVSIIDPANNATVATTFIASGVYADLPAGSTIECYVYDGCGKKLSGGAANVQKGGFWSCQHTVPAGAGYKIQAVVTKTFTNDIVTGITAK